jgi:hypothetical protein
LGYASIHFSAIRNVRLALARSDPQFPCEKRRPKKEGNSARSISSTGSAANASQSGSTVGCDRRKSSTSCPIGSSCGAWQITYGPTSARSSSARQCGSGSPPLARRPPVSGRGPPSENGYCGSFKFKLRGGSLNGEIFDRLAVAKIVIESWRRHYNTKRPHSSLG